MIVFVFNIFDFFSQFHVNVLPVLSFEQLVQINKFFGFIGDRNLSLRLILGHIDKCILWIYISWISLWCKPLPYLSLIYNRDTNLIDLMTIIDVLFNSGLAWISYMLIRPLHSQLINYSKNLAGVTQWFDKIYCEILCVLESEAGFLKLEKELIISS